jgi:hypothetical protein
LTIVLGLLLPNASALQQFEAEGATVTGIHNSAQRLHSTIQVAEQHE